MKQRTIKQMPLAAGMLLAACTMTPRLHAGQALLEEVIVTAQKHEENIQTVPIAMSAMTGEDLEKRGAVNLTGILESSPSVSFSPFPTSPTALITYIRGQGEPVPISLTSESAVGFYVDGFIIARAQSSTFDLADVERVEILRGPQGTLYGRNTTGGAINVIARQPTGEFGFKQSLSFGTRSLFRSLTAINVPEWNGISTKLSVLKRSVDGFVKNAGPAHDFGELEELSGRLALHWNVSDSLTVDYFMDTGTMDSTPYFYSNPAMARMTFQHDGVLYTYPGRRGPVTRSHRPFDLEQIRDSHEGHGLTLTWDGLRGMTVKSLTGYRDISSTTFSDLADSLGLRQSASLSTESHQFSQEFQLTGSALEDRMNYVLGLYYFKESGSTFDGETVMPDFNLVLTNAANNEVESRALYGQIGWSPAIFDDRIELILGARYTRDDRTAERFYGFNGVMIDNGEETGARVSLDYSRFNPSFTVNFLLTDDLTTYARVATGYKAGGAYLGAPPRQFGNTFDPEEVTSYELGLKSYWFDRKLRLNLALFRTDYEDMQVAIPVDAAELGNNLIYNAGESTIDGLELEALFAPVEDLVLGINYAYLDAKIDRVDVIPGSIFDRNANPMSPYSVGSNIKDVFVLPHAPEHSVDVSADYTLLHFDRGSVALNLNYRWQDVAYQNAAGGKAVAGREFDRQDSYGTFNARITMKLDLPRGDSAQISLWGKNITDREYVQQAIPLGGGPVSVQSPVTGNITPGGYSSAAVAWSEPASYGIDLVYEY